MAITLKSREEIEKMRVAGRLASEVLDFIESYVRPGMTTAELDERLRVAVRALRAVDWQIGSLLDAVRRRRLHRLVGFRVLGDYIRDRVGIAPRTADDVWAYSRAWLAAEIGPV